MPTSEAQLASYSMGIGALSVPQLACETHHSPPSSARMCGGVPHFPICLHNTQELTAAGGGGGGDNEQRFGKCTPVYPFNRWLTGTRAGRNVLERRSPAPAKTRTQIFQSVCYCRQTGMGWGNREICPDREPLWRKSDRIGICKKYVC